ncbi:MAG: spondin domain-containing protein [Anaerolineae bacterium]
MDGKLSIRRMGTLSLALVAVCGACVPATTTPTATPAPVEPTAAVAPTATAQPAPEVETTATVAPTEEPTPTTEPTPTAEPTATPEEAAQYQLTFEATWSEATHPVEFPPNPHFSGLIGATHSVAVRLWQEGQSATAGIKNMAETGGKSPLNTEIEALIASGEACELISGGGIAVSPGSVGVDFTASLSCPLVSVVSMIAPSPDWFVGVAGTRLLGDDGWIDELVVDLYAYDAGTDSGVSYTSPNEPTEETGTVYRIEEGPVLVDGQARPLGVFRFVRLDE